ncbi:hypothetical protein DBR11_17885 [Pedobacter sp. HMWF019]|nr:hypothetical protein DBR11_17885 [Pedobacter sp. HMWF019]
MFILVAAAACKKEAAIVPETIPLEYHLPQGNHPYDTQIVDFYHKYGCYILYKFSDKDFNWNISYTLPYVADQGDENYITPALTALDEYLFKYYNKDFLTKALPYKIILSSRIRALDQYGDTLEPPVNVVSASSHFAFGRAGSSLAGMTEDELHQLKVDLHREFWNQAVSFNKVPLPPVFIAATNYSEVGNYNKQYYGVFVNANDYTATVYSDFVQYIDLIASHTAEELEQTLFLPENDPNGKYKFKYITIINYYKQEYGIDLQAIAK